VYLDCRNSESKESLENLQQHLILSADRILSDVPARSGQSLQKPLIMADQQQAARAVFERLLQAFNGGQIEVIRRFVHDDQMGLQGNAEAQQQFSQLPGAGFDTLHQPGRARIESAGHGHYLSQNFGRLSTHLLEDLAGRPQVDLLGQVSQPLGRGQYRCIAIPG
jgi:hypothetical protein